jgi:tRNA dimethylallyltransferase
MRNEGYTDHSPGMNCVGYREWFNVEKKVWTHEYAVGKIKQHTRRYAKRQITWLRRQTEGYWIDTQSCAAEKKIKLLLDFHTRL